ncbi:hypothetical protein M409DRAFT_22628 [Zasmidium cellare ATCC 36951]|uniref:Protein kinase domain-containing protein n=1 Tax=Zasmidium cellare ATCC 36951 TaxID=1080233 RepID=A0A6A6CM14_ZASCE|nr:uncharacterized protein M409DRAFT_22628 [Zasmidium cellare ATCC 36951]KAF2167200.1 hypothetical protein M409DRAFT_22628 [Zasmidium cellare ATCC 36951]
MDEDSIPRNDYSLPGWGTGPEGVVIYVQIRNTQLNIYVNTEDFYRSPQALEKLVSSKAKFLSDSSDDIADAFDYCEEIASYFLPALRKLVPRQGHVGRITLADIALHHSYQTRATFHDEELVPTLITQEDPEEDEEDKCHFDATPADLPFPRFLMSDVEVLYEDPTAIFDVPATKVMVRSQQLFWKPSWMSNESLAGLEKYSKIHASGVPAHELRTSRLYGIVVNGKDVLRGQLYYWIDIGHHLTWHVLERASSETRAKWVSRIRATVSSLHAMGVVWGDVIAGNVIIDTDGNAIAIDFEGGATKGWVDKEHMGTIKGDLQGLETLVDYILNDNCPLRVRDKELDRE